MMTMVLCSMVWNRNSEVAPGLMLLAETALREAAKGKRPLTLQEADGDGQQHFAGNDKRMADFSARSSSKKMRRKKRNNPRWTQEFVDDEYHLSAKRGADYYVRAGRPSPEVDFPGPSTSNYHPAASVMAAAGSVQLYCSASTTRRGTLPVLLFKEKALTRSDTTSGQSRFRFPLEAVAVLQKPPLLSAEEEEIVMCAKDAGSEGLPVTAFGPLNDKQYDLRLKHWGSNDVRCLAKNWMSLVRDNGLREGMVVRMWAWRDEAGKICILTEVLQH